MGHACQQARPGILRTRKKHALYLTWLNEQLTATAAAAYFLLFILAGGVAGPLLAQETHFTGIATAASLVTLIAAVLTFLIVPRMPATIPAQPSALDPGRRPGRATPVPDTSRSRATQ